MVGAVDGSLIFDTKIDTKGFTKGSNTLKKQAEGLGSSFKKLGGIIGLAVFGRQLVKFGKEAVQLASDLQEVQNVVDTAFGEMSYKMEQFADTCLEMYGISKLTAKEMGSVFMAMAKGIGQAGDIASDKAIEMTGRMADIMSFYNKTVSEVNTIGRAVYSGETEPLKQIGVIMTENNLNAYTLAKGYKTLYKEMSAQDKLFVRQEYFLEQTNMAAGDFSKTVDSWANQTRILSERWKEFLGIIGNGLIQITVPMVKYLNTALSHMIDFAQATSRVLSDVFGFEQVAHSTQQAASGISEVGDAVEETSKQVKKNLSPIDELNIISDNMAKSADEAAEAYNSIGLSAGAGTNEVASPLEEGIKNTLLKISRITEPATEKLKDLWDAVKETSRPIGDGLKTFYEDTLRPLGEWTFTDAIPRFLGLMESEVSLIGTAAEETVPAFEEFLKLINPPIDLTKGLFINSLSELRELVDDIEKRIKGSSAFNDLKEIFAELEPYVNAVCKAFSWIFDILLDTAKQQVLSIFENAWRDVESTLSLIKNLLKGDLKGALKDFYDLMLGNKIEMWKEKWEGLKGILEMLRDKFPEIKKKAKEAFEGISKVWADTIPGWFDKKVKPMFTKEKWEGIFKNIGKGIGTAVVKMCNVWDENITPWWEGSVKPWFTIKKWSDLYKNISGQINGTIKTFGVNFTNGMFNVWQNNIEPWFTWKRWQKLGKDMMDGLYSGFKGVVYKIVDVINSIIGSVENMINGIIGMINKVIEGYNSVSKSPRINTMTEVSYKKVSYPRLASGTVVPANYGEFKAILGDNKREPEVVSPLSTMKQALKEAMAEAGGVGNIELTVNLDGEVVYRNTVKYNNRNTRMTGRNALLGGV